MTVIETTAVPTPVATIDCSTPLTPLESVFDALVKAVAKEVMANVSAHLLDSNEFDIKVRELVNEEGEEICDHWARNNFDIYDYEDTIKEMTVWDDDDIRRIIKDMSFTVSVD
ncbi:MAG: hypothetical protein EBU08_17465 [Micrococcales bacterium]|nr:hypothetical protein [Micrococcales bacterium]